MVRRAEIDQLIRELHAARVAGDLTGMCRIFADDGVFRIAGASDGKPIAINANGLREFRPWLSMMVKAFRISGYSMLSTVVESDRVAAHWRATIHSKITGTEVETELIDLAQVRDGRIASFTEFFVPR
jgi:ketosteroid isomerase-like protein